jgi:hypothetical protein
MLDPARYYTFLFDKATKQPACVTAQVTIVLERL